jgi:hypothetical protein
MQRVLDVQIGGGCAYALEGVAVSPAVGEFIADAADATAEVAGVVTMHAASAGVAEVVVALDVPTVTTAPDAGLPDVSVPPSPSSEIDGFATASHRLTSSSPS